MVTVKASATGLGTAARVEPCRILSILNRSPPNRGIFGLVAVLFLVCYSSMNWDGFIFLPTKKTEIHHPRYNATSSAAAAIRSQGGTELPTDTMERKIASTLSSIVHVTHTHTSSNDTWDASFDTLGDHGRSLLGETDVKFVVCIDQMDSALNKWPWLEVVEYSNRTEELDYPQKVVNCLQEVVARHNPKMVLHTMEDMILTGPIRWELVAAAARILAASPDATYFRFGCYGGVHNKTTFQLLKGAEPTAKQPQTQQVVQQMLSCGDPAGYTGIFYTDNFSVVPILVRPDEWIQLHKRHAERGTNSGSRMESWSYSHKDEPGPGLQGFFDGASDVAPDVVPTQKENGTPRRFAYPYIHTGVQFGMWVTADFAESLCPALEAQGLTVAGAMNCKTDLNASPPCLCDNPTQCQTKDGLRRKFWKVPDRTHRFPLGCISWREEGRPEPPPVSGVGPAVETALREEGVWEALDLDKAWAS